MSKFVRKLAIVLVIIFLNFMNLSFTQVHAETYAYSDSATSGLVTMTVEWNDSVLGQPTTFHVSATGGSGTETYIHSYNAQCSEPTFLNN